MPNERTLFSLRLPEDLRARVASLRGARRSFSSLTSVILEALELGLAALEREAEGNTQ